MRKALLYVVVGVVCLIGTIAASGAMLPVEHSVSGTRELDAPPAAVFEVISDFSRYPEWRTDVTGMDVSGEPGAGQRVVEHGANGAIPYRIEAYGPPTHLVMRIDDADLPFGGTWTYELSRTARGTRLVITEDGAIYNVIFRFMAKYVFGHTATIEQYLGDLERRVATAGTR